MTVLTITAFPGYAHHWVPPKIPLGNLGFLNAYAIRINIGASSFSIETQNSLMRQTGRPQDLDSPTLPEVSL